MAKTVSPHKSFNRSAQQNGFTLVEVMISMAVMTIGLVSLLGVFGIAMASTQGTQQDMLAKQLANESLESIVTARNTSQLAWTSIQNQSNDGIFVNGMQPIYESGADGIVGTTDDSLSGKYQTLTAPGADGIFGTGDDVDLPLTAFQRQIDILPVVDSNGQIISSVRAINITVQYNVPQKRAAKTYVLSSFISQYR